MRNIKSIISAIILSVFAINLSGCATGTTLVTGVKRDATNFEQVKIYHTPPANYEVIAAVRTSGFGGFSQQSNLDQAIEELKVQAAKVGANGVILKSAEEVTSGSGGTFIPYYGGGGAFISNSRTKQQVSGIAIYVK